MEQQEDDSGSEPNALIDATRGPRGVIAAAALVRALAGSDDREERHYLELKGPLNLTQKQDLARLRSLSLQPQIACPTLQHERLKATPSW